MPNAALAAQYIRMSTEHQRYSADHQAEVIARCALDRKLAIVRTYADLGKSGLTLAARPGLKQLLADVEAGPDFGIVLVYDVSRWGRFQDPDEAASCEMVCKRRGVSVHYCAEAFENDASPTSSLIKGIKRLMAGEYSRELSAKSFAGQARSVAAGYHRGGRAPYGLRRHLLGPDKQSRAVLNHGERRALQSDRVALRPGPLEEVEVVRWIFHLFTVEQFGDLEIARILTAEKLPSPCGRWEGHHVRTILRNPAYAGDIVFNRTSRKLGARSVPNPRETWLHQHDAFEAIVPRETFEAAQRVRASRYLSNSEILRRLREHRERTGTLTRRAINADVGLPHCSLLEKRFGTVTEAYRRIGYTQPRSSGAMVRRKNRVELRERLVSTVVDHCRMLGLDTRRMGRGCELSISGKLKIGFACASIMPRSQANLRNRLSRRHDQSTDLLVIGVTDNPGERFLHFHILSPEQLVRATYGEAPQILALSRSKEMAELTSRLTTLAEAAPTKGGRVI